MMENRENRRWITLAWILTALSGMGILVTIAMRMWMTSANTMAMVTMLLVLAVMGVLAFLLRGRYRVEVEGSGVPLLSIVLLVVGGVLAIVGGIDVLTRLGILNFFGTSTLPAVTPLSTGLQWLQTVLCLLSGMALVRLGWMLLAEGASYPGMARWSLLVPIAWMWLALANYEMSYAAMVHFSEGFFTLAMYIFEMLFLLCFARYIAGIGRVGMGALLFCSAGAAMFALSAPLVQLLQRLLQQPETTGPAGIADAAVGLLALVVCLSLAQGEPSPLSDEPEEEEEEESWSESSIDLSDVEFIEEPDPDAEDIAEDMPE